MIGAVVLPDVSGVTTWQQVVILVVVLVAPSVGGWIAAYRIKHESNPNNGGSMKDSLNRIEAKVTSVETTLKDHGDALASLGARVSDVEDAVTDPESEE